MSVSASIFPVTTGTYATTVAGSFARTFFAKISPVLFPTTNTLTVSPLTTVTGVPVTFTSVIASTFYSAVPTGTVTFMNGAATLGTGVLDANGKAIFSTSSLATGTYTVTAVYSADANYAVSTSSAQTLQINVPVVPVVTPALSGTSVSLNANVTFTATVSGTSGTPTGTVMFYDGITLLGSNVLNGSGVTTYSIATLAAGTHSIIAKYLGDNVYGPFASAAQTLTVNKIATTTVLTASATTLNQGASTTFTATITPTGSGSPSGSVSFLDGATTLGSGTLASGVATYSTAALAAGSHSITAVYAGDASFATSTSTALTITVVAPTFSLAASPTSVTVVSSSSATTTLTVTPAGGYTGNITLACGTLPSYMTCTFANATMAFTGTNVAQTSVLTLSTTGGHAMLVPMGIFSRSDMPVYAVLFGLMSFAWKTRRHRRSLKLLMALFAVITFVSVTGCGSAPTPSVTPAGTYTVAVSATPATGTASSINLQVTVQ